MHVPTLPSGTHPIGNYRVQPAPPDYRLQVQCVGQWHPVTPHPGEDTRTLLQTPSAPCRTAESPAPAHPWAEAS